MSKMKTAREIGILLADRISDAILRNGRKVKQLRLTDFPKETRSLSAGSKDQTPS